MASYTCFFKKKLNNFVGFITPVVVKWLIHMKSLLAAAAFLVLHVFITESTTATTTQIEMAIKSLIRWNATKVYNSIYTAIYMYLGLYL